MAKPRSTPDRCRDSAWRIGWRGMLPSARCRSKSGDSRIVERASQTAPASAAPTRKGIRHPQLSRSASDIALTVSAETATASSAPISLDAAASEATRPRRFARRAFQQIGDDPGIFAAHREAHHAAQKDEQPGGERADLRPRSEAARSRAWRRTSPPSTEAASAGVRAGRRYGRRTRAPTGLIR